MNKFNNKNNKQKRWLKNPNEHLQKEGKMIAQKKNLYE
jgi:hypothetical protein